MLHHLEYQSHKAVIWPNLFLMAMSLISCPPDPEMFSTPTTQKEQKGGFFRALSSPNNQYSAKQRGLLLGGQNTGALHLIKMFIKLQINGVARILQPYHQRLIGTSGCQQQNSHFPLWVQNDFSSAAPPLLAIRQKAKTLLKAEHIHFYWLCICLPCWGVDRLRFLSHSVSLLMLSLRDQILSVSGPNTKIGSSCTLQKGQAKTCMNNWPSMTDGPYYA